MILPPGVAMRKVAWPSQVSLVPLRFMVSRQSPVVSLQPIAGRDRLQCEYESMRIAVLVDLLLLTTSDWRLGTDFKRFFCLVLGNSVTYVCRVEP